MRRGGRHLGITGGQAIKPWALQPFQIRQTLKTRHLDVGRGGSRHGHLMATLQFGDGAGQTPPHVGFFFGFFFGSCFGLTPEYFPRAHLTRPLSFMSAGV